MSADKQIADVLAKYDEPVQGNIWRVQGQPVIYHKTVERIAAKAGIRFDPPRVLRSEREEAVILVSGELGERRDWAIGEALVNVNYRVSGKQAAYVYAMASKRARDRLVLTLIELHGLVYSEEEADEFKDGRPGPEIKITSGLPPATDPLEKYPPGFEELGKKLGRCTSTGAVLDLMKSKAVQDAIDAAEPGHWKTFRAMAWEKHDTLKKSAETNEAAAKYSKASGRAA